METADQNILNNIQVSFPINPHPYRLVGEQAGVSEEEAWKMVTNLRERGVIRRIGGVFNSSRLGYVSTLCAAEVPHPKISILADFMQGVNEITHNYLRDHPKYNMWFTIIASSQQRIDTIISEIITLLGSDAVYSLPAQKVFKIGVVFKFGDNDFQDQSIQIKTRRYCKASSGSYAPVKENEKKIVRLLQKDFPYSLTPYSDLAGEMGIEADKLLTEIKKFLELGLMRRLGAILVHHKSGFIANAMGVWVVPEEKVIETGTKMASFGEVTHCYHRKSFSGWPYNLYTMVHGRSDQECLNILSEISRATEINRYEALFSVKELKKISMCYFTE